MDVSSSEVKSATSSLKGNIDALSSSFTDSMIAISEGTQMNEVAESIKKIVEDNCKIIDTAADAIADTANSFNQCGGE